METTNRFNLVAVILLVLVFGMSAAPLMADDQWREVDHPSLDMLFTNVAAKLPVARQVYLAPVSVWYPTKSVEALDRAEALRADTISQLSSAFAANHVDLVDSATSGSIVVRVQLVDFTATPDSAEALEWQRRFKFNVAPGRLTIVAELIDAQTGTAVIRMADMQNETAEGLVEDLQSALNGWSQLVAQSVAFPASDVQLASR